MFELLSGLCAGLLGRFSGKNFTFVVEGLVGWRSGLERFSGRGDSDIFVLGCRHGTDDLLYNFLGLVRNFSLVQLTG